MRRLMIKQTQSTEILEEKGWATAHTLAEALPFIQIYDREIVVVKYGGHAMGAEDTAKAFARDIVLLEQTAINPVVVHGGGPQIATMLKRLGIQSEFAAGLRITDAATMNKCDSFSPLPSKRPPRLAAT